MINWQYDDDRQDTDYKGIKYQALLEAQIMDSIVSGTLLKIIIRQLEDNQKPTEVSLRKNNTQYI